MITPYGKDFPIWLYATGFEEAYRFRRDYTWIGIKGWFGICIETKGF